MSGTGKSTVIQKLSELGYNAVDLDQPDWSEYNEEGDWIWREDRVRKLLAEFDGDILFVSGCATNQVEFRSMFDHVILLSAPQDVIIERLRSRTNNPYGKRPEELAEVLGYMETVEPLLRRGADYEIVTTVPMEDLISSILRSVGV
ncbi:MAG TPA: AAA family ATPase [Firmicutes bacterium]|nr:AAA family ATPase [Candidatus Fermentithermobacillaceae bacterium]